MHKVFISYHHQNDQYYKDRLVEAAEQYSIFIDASVDTGDISDHPSDQAIRETIRDEYLRDSTVTDCPGWKRNPAAQARRLGDLLQHARWKSEQEVGDPSDQPARHVRSRTHSPRRRKAGGISRRDFMDDVRYAKTVRRAISRDAGRIVDNLIEPKAKISVLPWSRVDLDTLRFRSTRRLVLGLAAEYDLSRPMRRANS